MEREKNLLTEKEAASQLDLEPQTLRYWRHTDTGLPYLRLNNRIRYRREDVQKFLDDSLVVPKHAKRPRNVGSPRAAHKTQRRGSR